MEWPHQQVLQLVKALQINWVLMGVCVHMCVFNTCDLSALDSLSKYVLT